MSQLVVMIAKIDEIDNPERMTELWRQAVPEPNLSEMKPEKYLDGMENQVEEIGISIMRRLFMEQWKLSDKLLVEQFRQEQGEPVIEDGFDDLKVASRIGILHLPRQVCYLPASQKHLMPGNAGLPEHEGQVTTHGLQEWACLLPRDLEFSTAQRLLGWVTHEPEIMSETQLRRWVVRHGQFIRDSEKAEVEKLEQMENLDELQAQLQPSKEPRRPAAWDEVLNQEVEKALADPNSRPPKGITTSDWGRVLQARREEPMRKAEELRRLGPEVRQGEVIASVDEVVVRQPEKHSFLELGTAYVRTSTGYRYLSGDIGMVLRQLFLLLTLCGGPRAKITLLGDGARWIINFFQDRLASWSLATLIWDWYHCCKKCYDLTSMICRGQKAKQELVNQLLKHLWRGQVQETLDILEEYRPQTKNVEKLDMLINYIKARRAHIPNYHEHRLQRHYIGSAHVEKGNDLLVARRQKNQGMHWRMKTSDALTALQTLLLNGGWDLYWQKRQVLPLAIPSST
jgi:mRNA-degrading endonuclease YafQ of YafQ-DinJ toxin-antitoxin module